MISRFVGVFDGGVFEGAYELPVQVLRAKRPCGVLSILLASTCVQ